jgi:phosphotriesterase-related protein
MTITVETTTGPLDSAKLGTTLMHEHIINLSPDIQWSYANYHGWDPAVVIPQMRDAFRRVKEGGIDTIVDMTVAGLGRDINVVEQAVRGTGLQVIVATGMYIYNSLPWVFRYGGGYNAPEPRPGDPDPLLDELFLLDIQEGIQGTGIKAGMLKCATDSDGITPHVERVIRSCARVSRETGVPITTHTHPVFRGGLEQQQIFREEGLDLSRVIIGHCGDQTDLDYLERLIDAGSLLGMDRFGPAVPPPLEVRADTVAELCARGYADRMVLSHDSPAFHDWWPQETTAFKLSTIVERFLYVPNVGVPALKDRGVTQEQIDQMLIHTPRRFFEGS